ncbi:hypothetical protein CAI21_19540 [Alkalilimnicola ehrlichii]|uniref:Hemin uptake protein HemP n=1 Tax=Alkalilimnicola ehrlichii TaxID=351052 RepID=A0A3E0WKE3_9GAMM|nr:hemin uptake protein HemP [Alkalilimnicola ehrlichii]RFA25307.1 hypothetical protein CAI21_19540 [Alkalilimnicola ehrlichii]RFA32436.1 hypothetical protein CAL65_19750 [Alkalilimnicola ehrlichii]
MKEGQQVSVPPRSGACEQVIRSQDLLQGRREVYIRHGETLYRLQATSNGKLILIK